MPARPSHLPLVVALIALALWTVGFVPLAGRDHLHEYTALALSGLSGNEAAFYASVAFVEILFVGGLGIWIAARWGARADRIARAVVSKRSAGIAANAALGGVLALIVAVAVVRLHTLTEDEKTYLFQSKLLLLGKLAVDIPPGGLAFREPFLVVANGRWSGQYFWAQPALLTLGLVAHAVYVVPALEVACTVFFTGRLVEAISGDRRAAVLASGIVATSPLVVMTGATLLNDNLSAACSAASLFALARLHRRADRTASLVLGLATAIALHNRALDQAAILFAAACVLATAHAGARVVMMRRLVPSILVALPLLALHPLFNNAVSGDWRHSGYWLHAQGHAWSTFGFGTGPGGFPNDESTAAAKTVANGVRLAFYTGGGPILFAPLAACFVLGRVRGVARAAAWVTAVYFAAYLVYASASIVTTGPVYYDALVPVLAGAAAIAALSIHDALRARDTLRRLVPAMLAAQLMASAIFFFPPALIEVARAASDSAACDDLAQRIAPSERAIVFVAPAETRASWTFWKPMPSPLLDDRILFAKTTGADGDAAVVAQTGGGRSVYFARCVSAPSRTIDRYDPTATHDAPHAP